MNAAQPAAMRGGIMLKLLLACTALFALAALGWMLLLPYFVTHRIRERTGFDASVASLMVNPFTGRLVVSGLVLNNPPTFPRAEFLQVRAFEADAELLTLFTNKPVFSEVTLDIALVALVKRADGRTNAKVFQEYLAGGAPSSAGKPARQSFHIRKLRVRFDRFMIADYTPRRPVVREYALNLDRSFSNITDTRQLLLPASVDQLFALGGAVGTLLPEDVTQALDRALRSGTDVMRELTRRGTTILPGFTDALEESKKP